MWVNLRGKATEIDNGYPDFGKYAVEYLKFQDSKRIADMVETISAIMDIHMGEIRKRMATRRNSGSPMRIQAMVGRIYI